MDNSVLIAAIVAIVCITALGFYAAHMIKELTIKKQVKNN